MLDKIRRSTIKGVHAEVQQESEEEIPTTVKKLYPAKWDLDY